MDGVSRYLAQNNSVLSLVSFRYWFVSFLMLISCLFIKDVFKKIALTKQPFVQLSRGIILSVNNCIVIYSFTLIGLVETHAVIACYPLVVAGLSVPFLGEKMGWRRWSAIAIGFIGVVIILRPSLDMFSAGSIIALVGAILFAIYIILTRYVSKEDDALTSFFWMGIGGTVTMSLVSIFTWENIEQEYWIWLLSMCIISASSHFLMVKTLNIVQASVIQPFSYLQLVFASIIGVTFFSETVNSMIILGTTIVILAGLFTFWREYKLNAK
tara:strand:- start:470 stop:1276 length:807 start_codon:yes stop_codon:yes gene_type:complete